MRRRTRGLLALSFTSVALASAGAAAQNLDGTTEPSNRLPDWPSALFVELGAGPGFFRANAGSEEDERTLLGVALATELAVGGEVLRGFTLGAAYLREDIFRISAHDEVIDGDEPALEDTRMTIGVVAVFADWHPIDDDGVHVRGAVGLGTLGVHYSGSQSGIEVDSSDGIVGWSIASGYHHRLAGAFSLGVLARVTLVSFDSEGLTGTTRVFVATPSLLFTLGAH